MRKQQAPEEVAAIRAAIEMLLNATDGDGRIAGNAKFGIYAFYDYDGEPIYVGQTTERLRTRIRRHLTNQRTDAVAMNVLDPFEVAEIEIWPFFDLDGRPKTDEDVTRLLSAAEYTVFQKLLAESLFGAVLNEKDIRTDKPIGLPSSLRGRIIPDDIFERRQHPDVRIARRAQTIASLAKVISERAVSKGLRRTLVTQSKRLLWLAERRLDEIGAVYPTEKPGEETGEDQEALNNT